MDEIGFHYTSLEDVSVMSPAIARHALFRNMRCGSVVVLQEERRCPLVFVAGTRWRIAASAIRRLLARLHTSDQLHFLLPIAIHTSQHFGIRAASTKVTEYRPPAPSDDAE